MNYVTLPHSRQFVKRAVYRILTTMTRPPLQISFLLQFTLAARFIRFARQCSYRYTFLLRTSESDLPG